MVKDFTKVGKLPPSTKTDGANVTPQGNPNNQKIVLAAIGFTALGFFLAGVWLVMGMPSIFPRDISLYLGIGFIIASVADLVMIKVLKRAWAKKQG